jgi:hypothetical protein
MTSSWALEFFPGYVYIALAFLHLPVSPLVFIGGYLICLLYVVCVGASAEQVFIGIIQFNSTSRILLTHRKLINQTSARKIITEKKLTHKREVKD